MRILGLDVGEKRIGVARADSNTRIAIPVGTIVVDGSEWQEIARLTRVYDTNFFVLGLPRSNEGNETAQSLYVRNFAKTLLNKQPNAKIRFQDESLTSVEAERRLKARKKTYEKGEIDAEAASIILQDFIENFNEKAIETPTNTNIIKKQAKKAMLKSKKVTTKSKKLVTKLLVIPPAILIVILLAIGGILLIKDYRAKLRAEEYAREEAAMQAEVFDFTIRPGENIFEIKQNLLEIGYSTAEIEAAFVKKYTNPILAGRPSDATLEGYLFGETYEFYKTTTVEEIIETFLKKTEQVVKENDLEARFANHDLTLHEGITLASIVQKEASSAEQPTVAQIFYNRLNSGWFLGSDVTTSYALDVEDPNREIYTDNASAVNIDSCYNTRNHLGLPCGPISNPGLSALLAVAEPSDNDYLYFLTGDDGMMYYSYREEEHLINVRDHCLHLCNVSL